MSSGFFYHYIFEKVYGKKTVIRFRVHLNVIHIIRAIMKISVILWKLVDKRLFETIEGNKCVRTGF